LILTVFLFVFNFFGFAQQEKIAFEKYGVEEGLPEPWITSVVQDDKGFIWLSTQNGLVKYDGYDFKVYRGDSYKKDNSVNELYGNAHENLILGEDGMLWIGSMWEGFSSFDPKTEQFTNFLYDTKDPEQLAYGPCHMYFEDSRKNIWMFKFLRDFKEPELMRYNKESGITSTYPHEIHDEFRNDFRLKSELIESVADSSIWQLKHPGNLKVWNHRNDTFEEVIASGTVIPGTDIKDTIRLISPGKNSHFLLTGDQGVYIWDAVLRKSLKAYTNITDQDHSLPAFKVNYAFEDFLGQYWIFQERGHITLIDPKEDQLTHFVYGEGPLQFNQEPTKIDQLSLLDQNKKGIWFGTTSGLTPDSKDESYAYVYYDFKEKTFQHFNEKFNDDENKFRSGYDFFDFVPMLDHSGLLWLGTRPNLFKQAPKIRQIDLYKHDPKDSHSIPSDTIVELFEDSRERLWIGTRSGVALKTVNGNFKQIFYDKNKTVNLTLRGVYEDSHGSIWISSYSNGLYRYQEESQKFDKIDFISETKNCVSIQEDAKGRLWVSVYEQGVYMIDGTTGDVIEKFEIEDNENHGLLSNKILPMFLDSKGTMWLGDYGNEFGLFKYVEDEKRFKMYASIPNNPTSLTSNQIFFITEDDLGKIWVGTDDGINLYDREKDIFNGNEGALKIPSALSYSQAGDGRMWVNTYSGGGLALVGPGINDVQMFGEDKGLLHFDINVHPFGNRELPMDKNGILWLPTDRGLSVFDTKLKSFKSYFEKDGMQKMPGVSSTLVTHDGDIWIGGSNGLNRIVPSKLAKRDTVPPKVVITSMGINDSIYKSPDGMLFSKSVSYTDKVRLKYWQKDISFDFVALHYLRSEDNMYSWKLENYDKKWSEPSKERHVSYTNLSPGKYTFRVIGSNADGIWNEEGASMEIVIAPPWWMTRLAYAIYALLAILIGLLVHKYQKAKTLRLARERSQKKELEQAKEIEKAYKELKGTQAQLIQSEKMASLGELTAGIAHEIQNPLNFVNNFSEVNTELLIEMKEEIDKKNYDEVSEIADDVIANQQKINRHGKRADTIVKGMLQHSRTRSGQKELTDINGLSDEFLRLAYHGLRAKDKSFNAKLETNFDDSIDKVNIIAQDIGRVILNLINNAFYAVNDRKKQGEEGYEPTVTVGTKKSGDQLEISVKDNGNGIPPEIKDKIFQPFFTSKPTGEGTGLGLSLSYDIVKAHGGALKVESSENKGTEFIIQLPL
jgi:signal transduction histidine kinase/ligand-binding sensor domain-containing protein